VNRCLVKMSLVWCGALLALNAAAQTPKPSAAQKRAKATTAAKPAADDAKTQTAAAGAQAAKLVVATTVTAAGSVIILADGIVANAAMAQIEPPAEGFVYEQ